MWDHPERDRHFVGEFNVGEKNINGEIIYNQNNGVILLNLQHIVEGIGEHSSNPNYLTGKLNSGEYITLCNNRCVKNHTQNFRFQQLQFLSDYMIYAHKTAVGCKFNKLVCVIENGLSWSGLTRFDTTDLKSITMKGLEHNHTYNWYGAKVNFSTCVKNGLLSFPKEEVCKIEERLSFEIESNEKESIEYFLQIRDNILSLISFAIKDNLNIEEQYLYDFDDNYLISEEITDYYKYHLITNEPIYRLNKNHIHDYNFFLKNISKDDDFSNTLEKLKPIFNLYLSLFKYSDMPIEMVFLNIVQALETFHSRFFYDNKKSKYVKSVEDRFSSLANYEDIKKLLLSETQMDENCGYIILLSRLNDMLIGDYDGLFHEFYATDPNYAQTIADTRHYYTHYGSSKEAKALKNEKLKDAIYILTLLLEYNVCKVLGIDIKTKTASYIERYFFSKNRDKQQ